MLYHYSEVVPESGDSVARVLREWAELEPDLDFTPVGIIARMARIRAVVDAEQTELFGRAGISTADFPVLAVLRRRRPPYRLTQMQLAQELALTPGTVSVRVDRLESAGLVQRDSDERDARVRWVELTPVGLDTINHLIPKHLALEERLLEAIDSSVRARLATDLALVLASLERRTGTDRDAATQARTDQA